MNLIIYLDLFLDRVPENDLFLQDSFCDIWDSSYYIVVSSRPRGHFSLKKTTMYFSLVDSFEVNDVPSVGCYVTLS